jgi:hypothetical protein
VIPRFGTKRNLNHPTTGDRDALIAKLLGKPFMPHQQYIADVLGEVDPRTGIKIYREAYFTAMRQVGKTTTMIVKKATCALDTKTPVTILFAAQEGKSALAKMIAHAETIKASPLGRMLTPGTPSTNNNRPHVSWRNGSIEMPVTEKKDSGHGEAIALGAITEAMSHRDDRYVQTMKPAMRVNPNAQLFVESTAGDATSIYWNETIPELRERFAANDGNLGRVALFDWSFADDEDPFAVDTWRRRIPGLGRSIRLEEIQHDADQATTPRAIRGFKRATGNIADLGPGEDSLFDEDAWDDTETADNIAGLRALTFDVANNRSWASVSWAGLNSTGHLQSELKAHERSVHWLVPTIGKIFDDNPKMARRIYCVPSGQAVTFEKALERAGIELVVLSRADYAGAAGQYYAGCGDPDPEPDAPRIYHRAAGDQLPLHVAVGGAAWTKGRAPVWDTLNTTTIVCPLVAVSVAPWAYQIEAELAKETYDPLANIF